MRNNLLPLFPTYANPAKWRTVRPVEQDPDQWQIIRHRILDREDFTCQYCGHRAEKYQIIHHLDEDPANNSEGNLAVICQMCNVVMHAGQGCVIQGVVDLYKDSKYNQADVIRITRRMRFSESKTDGEIIAYLVLRNKLPFVMDKSYLETLVGFVTSRLGKPDEMYESWRRWETGQTSGVASPRP